MCGRKQHVGVRADLLWMGDELGVAWDGYCIGKSTAGRDDGAFGVERPQIVAHPRSPIVLKLQVFSTSALTDAEHIEAEFLTDITVVNNTTGTYEAITPPRSTMDGGRTWSTTVERICDILRWEQVPQRHFSLTLSIRQRNMVFWRTMHSRRRFV